MATTDFGDPIYVSELPKGASTPGRKGIGPAVEAWLDKMEPGKGWAKLPGGEGPDGAHKPNRSTMVRKIAEEKGMVVKTVAVETGKWYNIYAGFPDPSDAPKSNGDATA